MDLIEKWSQETDRLISSNQYEAALEALETFAREHGSSLLAAVQMRRGDLTSLTEKELVMGESTQVEEEKKQLRYHLLKLRQALVRDARSKTSAAAVPTSGSAVPVPVQTFASSRGEGPVNMLFLYAPADQPGSEALQKSIVLLRRLGKADFFDVQRDIPSGVDREAHLQRALREAEIILLLLSNDFLASDECFRLQQRALELSQQNRAAVIPIQLNHCDWSALEISRLVSLPRDGRFLSEWSNPDAAYAEVGRELSGLVERVRSMLNYDGRQTSGKNTPAVPEKDGEKEIELDFQALRRTIGEGEIGSALGRILDGTTGHRTHYDTTLQLQARWSRLEDDLRRNLIGRETANIESSRIIDALLSHLHDLEHKP